MFCIHNSPLIFSFSCHRTSLHTDPICDICETPFSSTSASVQIVILEIYHVFLWLEFSASFKPKRNCKFFQRFLVFALILKEFYNLWGEIVNMTVHVQTNSGYTETLGHSYEGINRRIILDSFFLNILFLCVLCVLCVSVVKFIFHDDGSVNEV